MMYLELKKAIIDWLIEHEDTWQRVNQCHEEFKQYIYNNEGNYIIGGEVVSDFITKADRLLYSDRHEIKGC